MKKRFPSVSIVIPMYNSASTILLTLESIKKQIFPIQEIVVINDASTDNSKDIVNEFSRKNKKMHIFQITNKKNLMIAGSLSKGINYVKSQYVVLIHADCELVSKNEIKKLFEPFSNDISVVATYGFVSQPINIWLKYSFWEKFLFAFRVGKVISGLVGKIDCIKKEAYIKIGGYDIIGHNGYGGEDADIHMRLLKIGRTVETKALVKHLHYIFDNFTFNQMLAKRKEVAQAYGLLLSRYGLNVGVFGILSMLAKPVLAVGILIPYSSITCMVLTVLLFFFYYKKMFLTPSVIKNPLIFLTPIVFLFLIYYETFWTLNSYIRGLNIKGI